MGTAVVVLRAADPGAVRAAGVAGQAAGDSAWSWRVSSAAASQQRPGSGRPLLEG